MFSDQNCYSLETVSISGISTIWKLHIDEVKNIEIDILYYPSTAKIEYINMIIPCITWFITLFFLVGPLSKTSISELISSLGNSKSILIKEFNIYLSIHQNNPWVVDRTASEKQIDSIVNDCRIEKQNSNPQFEIFVNNVNVMDNINERVEPAKSHADAVVKIGTIEITVLNSRAYRFWKQGLWNDG